MSEYTRYFLKASKRINDVQVWYAKMLISWRGHIKKILLYEQVKSEPGKIMQCNLQVFIFRLWSHWQNTDINSQSLEPRSKAPLWNHLFDYCVGAWWRQSYYLWSYLEINALQAELVSARLKKKERRRCGVEMGGG